MFVGRARELKSLRKLIDSEDPKVAIVHGRRRIGKSRLVTEAFARKELLVFEGLEGQPKQVQIASFVNQLVYLRSLMPPKNMPHSWSEAFLFLFEELKRKPAHVLLDEFQWMANYRSRIVSELKLVWDLHLSKLPGITLVLCGSIASFMVKKVLRSRAFYGRADLVIHLEELRLPETRLMLPEKGMDELLEAQLLLGGVPKYLELLKGSSSVRLAMEELAFTSNGYLVDEFDRIFVSHFGANPDHEKIIAVLSANPYGLFRQQISTLTGVEGNGALSEKLYDLESAGLISSKTPFHKANSRFHKYFLADAYLRFYFSFIRPRLEDIRSGLHDKLFSRVCQSPAYLSWLGRAFEYLCINHARRFTEILGFSGIDFTCGPFFEKPRKDGQGVQVDLLFARADRVITLCEMKYTLSPIGKNIISDVERKVDFLKRKFPKYTIQRVLVTRERASKELLQTGYFYEIIEAEALF